MSSPNEKQKKSDCSFVAPSPLLKGLERDMSGKRSVMDCLRSKTIPAPEVKAVLSRRCTSSSRLDRQELHLSYCSLLTKYLGPLKDTANKEAEHSSLWFFSRMGTLTRFLQLVLEFREETEPVDEKQTEPDYVTPSATGDAEICKIILQLIRSVTGVVCSVVEAAQKRDDEQCSIVSSVDDVYVASDAPESFDAVAVACFVFGSVLRINHYVRSRPFLLSPLWKGLCDMALALGQLPACLIQETVCCLTDHLRDGCHPVLTCCVAAAAAVAQQQKSSDAASCITQVVDPDEQAFLIKILGFLLARLTVFFKMPVNEVDNCTFGDAVQVLTLLRGIHSAAEDALLRQQNEQGHQLSKEEMAFLKPYNQIAAKVDRCFNAWLSSEPTTEEATTMLSHARIVVLVKSTLSLHWEEEEIAGVSRPAFGFGKTLLLVKYLEDALMHKQNESNSIVWYEKDVESLLLVVEDLLLRSLPAAVALDSTFVGTSSTSSRLLARAMRAVSTILLKCETETACIASNVHPGRGRFFHVLVKWLLPTAGQRHPLSKELTITAVYFHILGLCGDPTNNSCDDAAPLLTILVNLLFDVRTVATLRGTIASLLTRLLRSTGQYEFLSKKVEDLIRTMYASFEKRIIPSKKERYAKRKRNPAELGYDIKNLSIVVSLLSKMTKPLRAGCGFLAKVNWGGPWSKKTLQAAAVHTAVSDFSQKHDFALLLQCFLKLWDGQNRCNFAQYMEQFEFFSVTVLRQVCIAFKNRGNAVSDGEIESTCTILGLCTATAELDAANGDSSFLPGPVFEAIRILGVIGSVLRPTFSKSKLKDLAQCFHRLLACQSWAIRASAMTSLVQFASTVPSVHKDVLLSCVPTGMQKLLHCRLQGKVHGQVDNLAILQSQCNDVFLRTIPPQRRENDKFFPMASMFTVPTGSYFMKMPIKEGRQAVVIFPPGQQSLKDIRYMLNDDDEGNAKHDILTLQGVSALSDGGAKLQLKQQN